MTDCGAQERAISKCIENDGIVGSKSEGSKSMITSCIAAGAGTGTGMGIGMAWAWAWVWIRIRIRIRIRHLIRDFGGADGGIGGLDVADDSGRARWIGGC